MDNRILCINPGSTSTRIAVFCGDKAELNTNVKHQNEELDRLGTIQDQLQYRYRLIARELEEAGVDVSRLDAVVGRGGALRPMDGGVYSISEAMLEDCRTGRYAEHPSNLGCQLALLFAEPHGLPSYVVDPPLVDEFDDVARVSGLPGISRMSAFHALNEKAVAQFMAARLDRPYDALNLVTAHLGSGISVTAHRQGRCVDNNYGSGGDGPFSPERCGRLPALALLEAVAGSGRGAGEWKKAFSKASGLVSYLGTNDALEIEGRIEEGDCLARGVYEGMIRFIAREIAAYCTVLDWRVDAIGITGAIARSDMVCWHLRRQLEFLCPVYLYPGEFEMEALADGGGRALRGAVPVKEY